MCMAIIKWKKQRSKRRRRRWCIMMLKNELCDAVTVMRKYICIYLYRELYWLKLDKQEVYNCTPILCRYFQFHSADVTSRWLCGIKSKAQTRIHTCTHTPANVTEHIWKQTQANTHAHQCDQSPQRNRNILEKETSWQPMAASMLLCWKMHCAQ